MSDFARPLGDAVKKARLELGFTQNEVAERINIDVRTVLNIENYKGNPKMEVLYPLIRTLHIEPGEIFYADVRRDSPALHQLQLLLSDCSTAEAEFLLSVCKAVLINLREKDGITIEV